MVRRSWSWRGGLDGAKGGWRLVLPLVFAFGALPVPNVHGADRTLIGYFDTGKRTALEDFEEEGLDDEYTYRNYHLKYNDSPADNLEYEVSTFQKFRDYKDTNALDNRSSTYKGKAAYDLAGEKKQTRQVGLEVKHREKRFNDTPRNEFEQNSASSFFTKAAKDLYRLTVEGGMDAYRYEHAEEKDETTWIGRINGNRYFDGNRVNLTSSYSIARTEKERAFKKRTKQAWTGKGAYKFDNPMINKATLRANVGQRDTKEDDESDIDYDYRYWTVNGQTYHDIGENTDTTLEYEHFEKNYLFYNRDHRGYSIQNEWKRVFVKNEKARWWASVLVGHREAKFALISGNNLKRKPSS